MDTNSHLITVAALRRLLADLPDDLLLVPNAVRNLLLLESDGDELIDVGYIDLTARAVVMGDAVDED